MRAWRENVTWGGSFPGAWRWPAGQGRAAAGARPLAGLEGAEKGLPAPASHEPNLLGMLRPRPVAWLTELATVPPARHPLAYVGSVILAQFILLLFEHVFV
jgi:hypothetical protein